MTTKANLVMKGHVIQLEAEIKNITEVENAINILTLMTLKNMYRTIDGATNKILLLRKYRSILSPAKRERNLYHAEYK